MSDQTIRILLIEDDGGDARFIRQALADATRAYPAAPSFDLTRARRLASGLKRLAPGKFDVVLLDLSLPDSQGLDTFIKVHTQAPQTPVIVLSDVEDRELALEAMQKGAQDCLVKGELSGSLLARAIRYVIERKRVEEAYQTLVERSLQGLVIVQDFRIVFVNNAFAEILGYTVEELLSLSAEQALAIIHPEDRALVWRNLQHRLAGKPAPPRYEYRGIRKDGAVCWLEMFASRIEYGGKPAVQAAAVDITERKRAEEMLQRSERFLRDVFEAIQDGISVLDTDLNVIRTNRWMERMYAHHMPLVGRKCYQVYQQRQSPCPWCPSLRTIGTGETHIEIVPYPSADSPAGWIEWSAFPIKDEQGHVMSVIEYVKDITERAQAEEALRASEALLNESQAIAHIGSWELDVIANRLIWSDEVYRIFGLQPQEFGATYEAFLDTVHPDDRAAVDEAYSGSLREGRDTYEIEHRIIRRDHGEVRIVHEKCRHVKDASGRIVRSVGMVQDITERRRAEEALRESEARYRAVIESQVDLIGRYLPDTTLTFVNDAYCIFYGKTREELIGQSFLSMIAPEFRELVRQETEDLAKNPRPLAGEYLNYRHDGKKCWIQWVVQCISDESGQVVELQAVGCDITERKRAEEALREGEATLQSIFRAAPIGIGLVKERVFQWTNEALQQMLGYTAEELEGQSARMIYPSQEEYERVGWQKYAEIAVHGTGSIETHFQCKDGKIIDVLLSSTALDPSDLSKGVTFAALDITARKRAEEALRRERDLVRRIMETSPAGIVMVNREGQITFANTRAEQVLGLTYVEIEKRTYNDPRWRITDYDGNPFPDEELPFRRVMATRQPLFDVRHAVEWPDGRRVLLSINAAPLFDEQGRVDGMVATVEDVTDRVRVERALREESAFRNTIITNVTEGLCVCHAVPEYPYVAFTVWNDRMTEITGYTMEEINRLGWYQTMYPDPEVQQRAVERMARVRVGEDLVTEEWTITRADGEKRILLISTTILETADREVHVLAVMQDITKRKQAEAELERLLAQVQEQAQQVREIMDTVPEGVLLLDSGYRVILANPVGKRDLATLANAQVGDTLTRLGDRPLVELLTSPPTGLWHEVVTDSRFFQVLARPIEDGPTPRGWVLVIRDMTPQHEAQHRAQQQERLAAVGQLAAGIAHDFNNIMAVIALYAGMLAQTPDLPAKAYERLQTVKEQAQRATDLIQQILDFSRRAVLERRPMDLLPFMKEQIKLLERTLPESIKIELVYGKDEYTVNADPTRMQQAIMNLAVNARDAMPEGGRLHIGLERARFEDAKQTPLPDMPPGEWVAISVNDTGVGIPPDVLPHIFEPFFTTKAVGEGAGLGLAQVYGIVRQHEGYIDVKTVVGAGTTFTLYLPALAVPHPQPPALATEQLPHGHGETILVVEDNVAARQAMVSSLEMLGYRTLQAANGQEALGVFEQHADEISLVLSDVVMPEMGGRALLQALRARDPQVRVVMLSGHPLGEELEGLREQGLKGWMLKPLSVEQLADVVAQALEDE